MSEPRAIVSVEGVTKVYQQGRVEVPALRGLDLEVAPLARCEHQAVSQFKILIRRQNNVE